MIWTDRAEELARAFVQAGVLTAKYIDDARHVAIATTHGIGLIVSWNFKHLATLLLANGADVEAKTYLGATPLDTAEGAESKDMMELLLTNHAQIDGRDRDGFQRSPLFNAVLERHRDVAEFLIQHHGI